VGKSLIRWISAKAYCMGRGHESKAIPCQDYVKNRHVGKVAVVALADGAGSKPNSRKGAEIAVNKTLDLFSEQFAQMYHTPGAVLRRKIIREIMREIKIASISDGANAQDYSCTLLFCATDGEKLILGQVGDGCIGLMHRRRGMILAFEPDKGEYINETTFVTAKVATKVMKIKKQKIGLIDGAILMSDGSSEALYDRKNAVFSSVVDRMIKWLDKYGRKRVDEAIESNLKSVIRLQTFDDCSIAVIKSVRIGVESIGEHNVEFLSSFFDRKTAKGVEGIVKCIKGMTGEVAQQNNSGVEGCEMMRLMRRNQKAIRDNIIIE
jgi:serine/threonine protein phosphatase PrpC